MTQLFPFILLNLIEISSMVVVIFYIVIKTSYVKSLLQNKDNYKNRIILTLFFGLISIYGTINGVKVDGAIANVRDLGPMIGGLLGGPLVGLFSGIIGSFYRWFYGGPVRIPCCLATVVAGLICGMYAQRKKFTLIPPLHAAVLAFFVEILHAILVLSLSESFSQGISVVREVSLSIVIANTFGLTLFSYIVMRDKQEQEILLKHKDLEWEKKQVQLHKQKINFFLNIAHDTKTPLTTISTYLEAYIKKVKTSEKLEIINDNIQKLLRHMNMFLDIGVLEKGRFPYDHNQKVNFSDLVKNNINLFQVHAEKKNIQIETKIDPIAYVKADPSALDSICNNLIDNAIKFTKDNGKIEVQVKRSFEMILFNVVDNGIGIPQDKLKHIFLPFYKISQQRKRVNGIGFGLHTVEKLIDSISGSRIQVRSEVERGSIFSITFKKAEPPLFKELSEYSKIQPITKESYFSIEDIHLDSNFPILLFVEDNRDLLKIIRLKFMEEYKNQYTVLFALDGKEALIKLHGSSKTPDIIISDIMMDHMDGYEFLHTLEKEEKYTSIPVIFLTAFSRPEDIIEGLSHGAIDYIVKPFSMDVLKAKIDSLWNYISNQKRIIKNDILRNVKNSIDKELKDVKPFGERISELCILKQCTATQTDVAIHLANGSMTYKEIGRKMHKSESTVESHARSVYSKFGVKRRTEFIHMVNKSSFYPSSFSYASVIKQRPNKTPPKL